MTHNNFDKDFNNILDFIFKAEGYFSFHVYDPGGYTILGITERYNPEIYSELLDAYRNQDLQKAYRIAKEFYYSKWVENNFHLLPHPINMASFDYFINTGKRAIFDLQKNTNYFLNNEKIKVDGIIGPKTIEAVKKVSSWNFLYRYLLLRIKYYNHISKNKKFRVFLRGWINRVINLMKFLENK